MPVTDKGASTLVVIVAPIIDFSINRGHPWELTYLDWPTICDKKKMLARLKYFLYSVLCIFVTPMKIYSTHKLVLLRSITSTKWSTYLSINYVDQFIDSRLVRDMRIIIFC